MVAHQESSHSLLPLKRSGISFEIGLSMLLAALIALPGCSRLRGSAQESYVTIGKVPVERADESKKLNSQALKALANGELDKAEKLLQESLASDVNYAPAHNNLGQIYLQRHQLYLAAWEFEFAANLMPDRIEPTVNLGLVYETAGKLNDAAEVYAAALGKFPSDRDLLSASARVAVKQDDDPGRVHWLLEQVVMHDDRPEWVRWANQLLATRFNGWTNDQCSNFHHQLPSSNMNTELDMIQSWPVAPGASQSIEVLPPPGPAAKDEVDADRLRRADPLEFSSGHFPTVPDHFLRTAQPLPQVFQPVITASAVSAP